jgi:hypothetical protein
MGATRTSECGIVDGGLNPDRTSFTKLAGSAILRPSRLWPFSSFLGAPLWADAGGEHPGKCTCGR